MTSYHNIVVSDVVIFISDMHCSFALLYVDWPPLLLGRNLRFFPLGMWPHSPPIIPRLSCQYLIFLHPNLCGVVYLYVQFITYVFSPELFYILKLKYLTLQCISFLLVFVCAKTVET